MEKKDESKKDNFVYFIDTHEKAKNFKISISTDYKEAESLEKIKQYERNKENMELSSEVYRFKIIPGALSKKEDEKYHVMIFAESDGGKKYQYDIKFSDDNKDIFIYDFNIEEENYQPLSHEEQFEIYIDILRKVYKKLDASIENENLISCTLGLLSDQGQKFNFYFYILIFLECHRTKYAQELLLKFDPENISELGAFQESKIKIMKTRLNVLIKNINKSLNLKNAKDENELIELFYSILLFFNINFQKEKIAEMFKDDKILDYLSKKLLSFRDIYKDLILDKETVRKLIKKSKTFDEILIYLPYIGKNIIDFLNVIYSEFKYICDIYKSEQEKLVEENQNKEKDERKEMKQIDIEKYVVTQKEDNMSKLLEVSGLIFTNQKLNGVTIIKFSENLIKNYVEYFNGQNMEALQLINKLIIDIKKYYTNFDFKYNDNDMDLIIHDTGIDIINRGEMKSNEILNFIASDTLFISDKYKTEQYRPVTILSKIKIEEIDEQFFIIWRRIKFNQIYSDYMENFYNTIANLIQNIKDFGILYKLFKIYESVKYEKDALKIMKKKYKDLIQTFDKEKCPNFIEDTTKLISLIDENDKNQIDIKDLLEHIQNNLNYEQVKEIYLKLSENKKISKNAKNIFITYLINDKNNSSPSNLIDLIKNFKNIRKDIFCKIQKYSLEEKDILSFEETENFKFFKGLIDNEIIEHDLEYKDSTYIKNVEKTINSLYTKIKNFDIKYSDVITFFQNEENKNLFKGKISYLNFLDDIKMEKNMENLESHVNEVKKKIDDFDLILGDFRDFFSKKYSKDIKKISKINDTLKAGNLNCFEKNYTKEYEKYSKYLDEAKRRNKLKESIFFNEILKEKQNKYKNDEELALKETEKSFQETKKILKTNGLSKDKNLWKLCLKAFRKNKEKIKGELKILGEIFKVDAEIENVYKDILLILKRKLILDATSSILVFINAIKPVKTDFIKNIENIIINSKEKKDLETIKLSNEKLIELGIFYETESEGENKFINILLKLREKSDSILFLLKTTSQDLINLQEIASSNDNNYNIVNIIDILDMEKCVNFFKDIGTLEDMKKMNDIDIIRKIKQKVEEKKDINIYFQKYVNSYGQIKLLLSSVDKSEFIKYKIETIFKGSKFILSNKKDEFFKCTCENEETGKKKDKIGNNGKLSYSREDIVSFRDRALLSKTLTTEYK